MYTDGVNEAFNEQWEEYGDQRMQNILEKLNGKSCQEIIEGQLEDVKVFAGNAPQSDDITLMALKRKA
jgi:sigma-B regulation protein RsbU (phosphoserine phosphatase)